MTPLVLTAISAMLYAAAFPPVSAWPLAWIALVPWLLACSRVTPLQAALLGATWGILAAIGVASWFPGMVAAYFERSMFVGWLTFMAAIIATVAGYYAAFAAWTSWLVRRSGAGPFLIACGWCATELARARVLVGNPWALIGYSQVPVPPIIQIADLAGPYGLGMVVVAVNVLAAGSFDLRLLPHPRVRAIAGVTGLALVVVGYGHWRLANPPTGSALRVGVLQGAAPRDYSWRPDYRRLGFGPYLALTRQAVEADVDLIVWPEHAVNFFLQEPSLPRLELLTQLNDFAGDVIIGGARYAERDKDIAHFNSVFLVRNGTVADQYDKRVLLPVAEEGFLGLADERTRYTRGSRATPFSAGDSRVGAFVCFEAMYSELVRGLVADGAELLVNLSNDAWFGSAAAARHHLGMTAFRAVENRRFILRSAGMGPSALIDASGRILTPTEIGRFSLLQGTVLRVGESTLYQRYGDALAWLAVVAAIMCTVRIARKES